MSHDASATWSGFNYQGKVALYHSLTLINNKLNENVTFDFSGYELILESHEDFDIKGPSGFISFHQVKAINQTALSTYQNALFAMLLQLDSPLHSAVQGYLHTWKPLRWIDIRTASFEEKLKGIIKQVIDDHVENSTNSIITKGFTNETVSEKKIKILRQAIEEDERLVDANSVLAILNQAYSSTEETRVVNRVEQYNYNGTLACNIEGIDALVKSSISNIQTTLDIPTCNNAQDKIFCALLEKLDENIIRKHVNLAAQQETPICFTELINIIRDENIRDSDEVYLASRFKLLFIGAFEEFLDDDELCSSQMAEQYSNKESNLNSVMDVLLNLPAVDLWSYFKKLNPHISWDINRAIDSALATNIDNLRQYLFRIFGDMCRTKFNHKSSDSSIIYKHGRNKYLPTTIGTQTKKNIVINIMNNSHAISSLFEVTAMITGCEHANEISSFSNEYSKLSEVSLENHYVNEAPEQKEKITQISQKIRLIKLETAIREISNA
jgi:hypothetical protein